MAKKKTKKKRPRKKKNAELSERFQECFNDAVSHFGDNGDHLEVDFPVGHIRTLASLKQRWPYLSKSRARTVACAIQLCDVNRLFLNTMRVSLTAGAMWEWHVTVPVVAVIETLCYEVVRKENWGDENVRFKKCINILHSQGIFKNPFDKKLHDLRVYRNNVHLYIHGRVRMANGKPAKYNEAVLALKGVESRLKTYYKANAAT